MTLKVALLLKPRLEALGATVSMVRTTTEPVTKIRPGMLREEAGQSAAGGDIAKLAERLFYRTAEIRARAALVMKLLQGVHSEERGLAESVAAVFVEKTGMPPYLYDPAAKNSRNVGGNPYLWARNLLANRLYRCPVVYFEPYVMNSIEDHARIQAGDYEGLREVAEKARPSIFRQYAECAALGLERYYRTKRIPD